MTSTLLFAAAIVAFLFILVFLFMYIGKRERKRQMEKQKNYFSKTANAFGISIDKKECFHNRMIGCDAEMNKVVFVDYTEDPYLHKFVELKNIKGCSVNVNTDNVTEKVKGELKVIDRITSSISLSLHFKNNTILPIVLPIYKYGIDSELEMQRLKSGAENWSKLINNKCK